MSNLMAWQHFSPNLMLQMQATQCWTELFASSALFGGGASQTKQLKGSKVIILKDKDMYSLRGQV